MTTTTMEGSRNLVFKGVLVMLPQRLQGEAVSFEGCIGDATVWAPTEASSHGLAQGLVISHMEEQLPPTIAVF